MQKKSSAASQAAPAGQPVSFHDFIDALPEEQSGAPAPPRIPPESQGIQLNFCKSPSCANYGIPPSQESRKGTQAHLNPNSYRIVGTGRGLPAARCGCCGESFGLKSNQGIAEELDRLRPKKAEPCCPDEGCSNYGVGVSAGKPFYSSTRASPQVKQNHPMTTRVASGHGLQDRSGASSLAVADQGGIQGADWRNYKRSFMQHNCCGP